MSSEGRRVPPTLSEFDYDLVERADGSKGKMWASTCLAGHDIHVNVDRRILAQPHPARSRAENGWRSPDLLVKVPLR